MILRTRFNTQKTGFTLLELLTVIGVLVILSALLFPVLENVRTARTRASCATNLRQIGTVGLLYASENDNQLVPLLSDPVGYWYDHLHEYVGRAKGRAGRNVGGVKVNYPGFSCPEVADTRYVINRITGYNKSGTYVQVGMGTLDGKVFELPGGTGKTAWFTCPAPGKEYFLPDQYGNIGFPHGGKSNVLYMDGHIDSLPDPNFVQNPAMLKESRWVNFFGKPL